MSPTEYDERLSVPLRWWVQGTMLVASIWLAFIVAVPPGLAWAVGGALFAVMAGVFWSYGSTRIRVHDGWLDAGHARIEVSWLGSVQALTAAQTKRLAGIDADARAYLQLRPYLARGVRVDVVDPSDPAPYWLLTTRHPEALAAAIQASQRGNSLSPKHG
ncbi:MAG: DUF3093 domain-containing protein [Nocardioides sp.]